MTKENYMKIAVEQAKIAKQHNEWIGGTIIVKKGEVVASAPNSVVQSCDPTAHAEINAIRIAAKNLGTWNLSECELYTTCESCPMCISACIWAGISKEYYGISLQDVMQIGDYQIKISAQEIVNKSFRKVELEGGILKEECLELYKTS